VSRNEPKLIAYCLRNVDRATFEWFGRLAAARPDLDIKPCGCLSRCSICVDTPFVQIDGYDVEGDSHESIVTEYLARGPRPKTVS
jgi:uncharacterized protein YuzB (UPF0349 family)